MAVNDTIADMLTRIRNAAANRAKKVTVLNSKVCRGIAQTLVDEGYISSYDVIEDNKQGLIHIHLKYGPNGENLINKIDRQSKPGCRVYRGVDDLPKVLEGLGIAILSTSHGVMSDRKAREGRIGGELLATVH